MKIFIRSLSFLIVITLLIMPFITIKAQSGIKTDYDFCLNGDNLDVGVLWSGSCPSGYDTVSKSINKYGGAICVYEFIKSGSTESSVALTEAKYDASGLNAGCDFIVSTDSVKIKQKKGPFKIDQLKPYGTVPNNGNNGGSPGNGNGTGNNGNGSNNGSNGSTNNGSTSNNGTQGNCESGFHEAGLLCVPDNPFNNSNNNSLVKSGSIGAIVLRIINIALGLSGIIAVLMLIYGGYLYITSRGNDAQSASGRKTFTNALIGLVIVVMAYAVVQAILSFIIK